MKDRRAVEIDEVENLIGGYEHGDDIELRRFVNSREVYNKKIFVAQFQGQELLRLALIMALNLLVSAMPTGIKHFFTMR